MKKQFHKLVEENIFELLEKEVIENKEAKLIKVSEDSEFSGSRLQKLFYTLVDDSGSITVEVEHDLNYQEIFIK